MRSRRLLGGARREDGAMTFPDRRIVDLTAFDRPGNRQPLPDQGHLHILRLVLDLQLDALLLTLACAARADSGHYPGEVVPWHRWLVEDLERARTLAAVLVDGEASSLPALGGGSAPGTVTTALDSLAVRFESMENLLVGVLDRHSSGQQWRGAAGQTLACCRQRVAELHRYRQNAVAAEAAARTTYLPGEWLG
jgi:hypothetical protein